MRISLVILGLTSLFWASSALSEIVSATGFGTVDSTKVVNPAQGKMMAKRAAKVDAMRQLSETVKGVKLTSGTTIEEYEVTSDIIATRIRGVLQGAFVLKESISDDDGEFVAEVEMGICYDNSVPQCVDKPTLMQIVQSNPESGN